jgi:hypothetical protein
MFIVNRLFFLQMTKSPTVSALRILSLSKNIRKEVTESEIERTTDGIQRYHV